jgi:pantetheine-phosphate adenylyltransferase
METLPMTRSVIAVYSGTFDPLTLGHEDVVMRAAKLFDKLVIAVAEAHHKKTMFTLDERLSMVREVAGKLPGVTVEPFSGLLRDFVISQDARAIVRVVRSVTDYDYESQMAGMNRYLAPNVDTVFLTTNASYQHISSTLVREIATLGGDVSGLVSVPVMKALQGKLQVR